MNSSNGLNNTTHNLTNDEISRYSRQLILAEIGPSGQDRLKSAKVLIVGAGGLGCPAALYLAAAGVGTIGVVDGDVVERNNLHRQIGHSERTVGQLKVDSLVESCSQLNSNVTFVKHEHHLDAGTALALVRCYDVILDCCDNVLTRYLVSDGCVVAGRPLVSASALRFEGQLTVYNLKTGETPCYRCIHPKPPPPETVTNCSDGGVVGVVPGILGSMQALEAMKIICQIGQTLAGYLLLFDGLAFNMRKVKLRGRRPDCPSCGDRPTIVDPATFDYSAFCGGLGPNDKCTTVQLLADERRISVRQFFDEFYSKRPVDERAADSRASSSRYHLIDVRNRCEFDICHIPHSQNIPLADLRRSLANNQTKQKANTDVVELVERLVASCRSQDKDLLVVCRRGNDSQLAVELLAGRYGDVRIRDLIGGLYKWHDIVDRQFPLY